MKQTLYSSYCVAKLQERWCFAISRNYAEFHDMHPHSCLCGYSLQNYGCSMLKVMHLVFTFIQLVCSTKVNRT